MGTVIAAGEGVPRRLIGRKVGVPWLGHTCGHCPYCRQGRENLCDAPGFTGYSIDGGFATHAVVEAGYAFELPNDTDSVATAPLLCAGLIGWRSLKMAGEGRTIGIYGFGAAAHILVQVCKHRGQSVYAFVRPGDEAGRKFALDLGAVWAGFSGERPPVPLDAAIIFAPAGELVPMALDVVRKGGTVVCGGIHMSDIPSMPYRLLWGERRVVSVANLTRGDGAEFFSIAKAAEVRCVTIVYALEHGDVPPGGLVRGVAEEFLRRSAERSDDTSVVYDDHCVWDRIKNGLEVSLSLPQFVLDLLHAAGFGSHPGVGGPAAQSKESEKGARDGGARLYRRRRPQNAAAVHCRRVR